MVRDGSGSLGAAFVNLKILQLIIIEFYLVSCDKSNSNGYHCVQGVEMLFKMFQTYFVH